MVRVTPIFCSLAQLKRRFAALRRPVSEPGGWLRHGPGGPLGDQVQVAELRPQLAGSTWTWAAKTWEGAWAGHRSHYRDGV